VKLGTAVVGSVETGETLFGDDVNLVVGWSLILPQHAEAAGGGLIGIPSSRVEEPSASLDHKTPSYRPPPKVPKCFASFHLTER